VVRTTCVPTASCDPCLGALVFGWRVFTEVKQVTVPVCKSVLEQQVRKYDVNVLDYRTEKRAVTVAVPTVREEIRTERVPVTTFQPQVETFTVRVPVLRETVETFQVPVCEMSARQEEFRVRVPECRPEVRTRRVAFTVFRTVTEVVTDWVPVTTCVKVPYQVRIVVPACPCP
jgi:hypothetical protein